MVQIKEIRARQILDSRGEPTLEVEVFLDDGSKGIASVPSGSSKGEHEAHELRDGGKEYGGKGVKKAIEKVKQIEKKLKGIDASQQQEIDNLMINLDGTENKKKLGANSILGISLAVAKAAAAARGLRLYEYIHELAEEKKYLMPVPMINIWNGGSHAGWATDLQEYMIVPIGASTFSKSIAMASDVFRNLKELLKRAGYATTVGDEGGFAPLNVRSNIEPLEWITKAIDASRLKLGKDIAIALDSAASSFYGDRKYIFHYREKKRNEGLGEQLSTQELIDFYAKLKNDFKIISIEDGLAEDDWAGWQELTKVLGKTTQIVGDDLYTTNILSLQKGIELSASNSILIKLNQIGTLTETLEAIKMAKKASFTAIVSHRSGETEDTAISHLVVGAATGQIKTGSLCRGERICKYNELLRIEEKLGKKAEYLGRRIFKF